MTRPCNEIGELIDEPLESERMIVSDDDFLEEIIEERTRNNPSFPDLVDLHSQLREVSERNVHLETALRDVLDSYELFTASLKRARKLITK